MHRHQRRERPSAVEIVVNGKRVSFPVRRFTTFSPPADDDAMARRAQRRDRAPRRIWRYAASRPETASKSCTPSAAVSAA